MTRNRKNRLFGKVNVWNIIDDHLDTLVNDNNHKHAFDDWFTFIIVPFIFSLLLVYNGITLENDAITIIITALSILVGLLFNVIVLLFDIIHRDAKKPHKNKLLKQLTSNISYSILISVLIIGVSIITYSKNYLIEKISDFVVYFLIANFTVTFLMILKRTYIMFQQEIKDAEQVAEELIEQENN